MSPLVEIKHDRSGQDSRLRLFVADRAQDDLLAVEVQGEMVVAHAGWWAALSWTGFKCDEINES